MNGVHNDPNSKPDLFAQVLSLIKAHDEKNEAKQARIIERIERNTNRLDRMDSKIDRIDEKISTFDLRLTRHEFKIVGAGGIFGALVLAILANLDKIAHTVKTVWEVFG